MVVSLSRGESFCHTFPAVFFAHLQKITLDDLFFRGGRLANLNDQHHSSRSQPAAIHHPRNHHAPTHQNSDDCDSDIGHIDLEGGNGTSPPRSNSVRVVPKNLKHFSISRKLAKFSKEKKAAKTLSVVMGKTSLWLSCHLAQNFSV